ncbi:centrosomal protein of 162 kDa-like isoform X2 [Liolophura sinensis]|uniref:centrosomal protein of 162 kDa-like isoform X2 n=1 Tax=Liolophura sinensis TaxID=3198878 RepID=UPI0031594CF6
MVIKMARKYADKDFDAQFDAFMKESLSSEDSINSAHLAKLLQPSKPREGKPWWLEDDESLDDGKFGEGLSSGKSFLKKKSEPKHSTPVYESEDGQTEGRTQSMIDPIKKKAAEKQKARTKISTAKIRGSKASSMSKDSLDDISEKSEETDGQKANAGKHSPRVMVETQKKEDVVASKRLSSLKPGADTLEELRDKEMFFKNLENDGESLDYGKLNRELSQTASGFGYTPEVNHQPAVETTEGPQPENAPKKPSMLSNVALMDSLESTLNTSTSPGRKGDKPDAEGLAHTLQDTLKTVGTGLLGTNTSQEILALQEAYRGVHLSPTIKGDDTGTGLGQDDSGRVPSDIGPDEIRPDYMGTRDTGQDDTGHQPGLDEPDSIRHRHEDDSVNQPKDRTMEEIMREMREIQSRGEQEEQSEVAVDRRRQQTDQGKVTDKGPRRQTKVKPAVSFQTKPNRRSWSPDSSSPNRGKKSSKTKLATVKSSGYGQRSQKPLRRDREPGTRSAEVSPERVISSKPPSPKKTPPSKQSWSPAHVAHQKVKGTQSSKTAFQPLPQDGAKESQLMASVESFVQYIRDQFSGTEPEKVPLLQAANALSENLAGNRGAVLEREKVLMTELKLREKQWRLEQEEQQRKTAVLENQERELSRKLEAVRLEYEEQIFKLKQENFVLSAKVAESESEGDLKKRVTNGGSLEGMTKEQVLMLEKEIKEQEQLMAGYQTENQRLYNELKTVQKHNKQTEERLFRENQKLIRDLESLRSQLERKDEELRNKGVITGLTVQQHIAAGNTVVSSPDAARITSLEADLQESKKAENAAKIEVERLAKKLKWYAENQELLDKDVICLKQKEEEIGRLKTRIEQLQSEAGRKVEESKIRARERAADGKKIQDLERQVKEMEQILRRRHPNSIPTLMMAACAADLASQPSVKPPSVQALETRLHKLESELENKDEECNKLLRAMEQKFNVLKLQYEERIAELEKLPMERVPGEGHPHTSVSALEKELEAVRERYRKQIVEMSSEINRLNDNLKHKSLDDNSLRNELKMFQDREKEFSNKVKALQQELELRDKTSLPTKESGSKGRQGASVNGVTQVKTVDRGKSVGKKAGGGSRDDTRPLSPYREGVVSERQYEPQAFTGAHVSDLQEENERLRTEVDRLQLELHQQRVDLRKSLAETEGVMRRSRDEYEEQIETLRASHQKDLQRVLTDQALQHSGSKMAELQNKVDTQEVMVSHLRTQLAQAQVCSEQVSVLKIRETALETQVKQLTEEVREAKQNHTPEMQHFESLREKISQMERRHEQREQELQTLLRHSQQAAHVELAQEREKWQKMLDAKNQEVRRFQTELDSILEVLRELKRQGVVLSASGLRS